MSGWLHTLPLVWMALVVFGATYVVAFILHQVVAALSAGSTARSFKALSPGMLPPLGIIFGLFVAFTLSAFAARGVDAAAARIAAAIVNPKGKQVALWAFGALLAGIACFELGPHEVRWMRVLTEREFPPVYGWLANRPEVLAVAEIPMFATPAETSYMYYSTAHWKPLANGFSGYDPPIHQELAARLRTVPSSGGLERLRQLGVTHLVIHAGNRKAHLTEEDLVLWAERLHGEVERVFAAPPDFVYAIRPSRDKKPSDRNPNLAGW